MSYWVSTGSGTTYCRKEEKGTGATVKIEMGDYGRIASEGYPNNYTSQVYHGHLCNVELQACSTCKIRLRFVELRFPDCAAQQTRVMQQIQPGPRSVCLTGCDHLRLFEVDQPYHSTTERNYLSSDEGTTYETMSSRVVIQHCMSNGTGAEGKRFYLEYEVIDKILHITGTVSSPMYTESTGIIISPNFPHGYALNGETFTYMIQNLDPYGHVQLVYDDLSGKNIATIYGKRKRPTIMSNANTLVLVFNVGKDKCVYCNHIGFKATYTFVSDDKWLQRPRTDCSDSYRVDPGGEIEFRTDSSGLPQWYDCVWTVKQVMANYPDGVNLRIDHVNLGEGWKESGPNSLEIYEGVTSLGSLLARYTTDNFTAGDVHFSPGEGLYIRLRGAFNVADSLTMVFTAVSNYTEHGCPATSTFLCDNRWCIHDDLTCDGIDHCGDNSDENPIFTCPRFKQ
ncbi:NETO2-like protein, partial [Mya arenaria]